LASQEKSKKEKTTMKKLMIVAAVAAMTFVSEAAGLKPTPCENCGYNNTSCDVVVFKVTGSGKAVVVKSDYKEVGSLKIKKGALALVGTYCEPNDSCCYDAGMFYATIKAGKSTFKLASEITPGVWSVFGKKLDQIRGGDYKQGKTYKLDSALFVESAGNDYIEGDVDVEGLYFAASAFGKVSVKISKDGKSSSCNPTTGCTPTYTPQSYSGWFVGKYACVGEEDCFLCDCTDTDVFGGTWKASYKSSAKTDGAAQRLAGVSYSED
jgi:hypothetical protein